MKVSVIIVSAGKSERMNGIDKQLSEISGIPVIIRSAMAFDKISSTNEIIIVTSSNKLEVLEKLLSEYNFQHDIKFTCGGDSRYESVCKGFSLVSGESDFVAIHDGARPLVSKALIENVFQNAEKHGASAPFIPLNDTVKIVRNSFVENTPDRGSMMAVQTPQVFKRKLYKKALESSVVKQNGFTDDCQLVEAIGEKVFITDGENSNIKITNPIDLKIAEILVKEADE